MTIARICLKVCVRWQCNGRRIDEIKRLTAHGVDRKVERGQGKDEGGRKVANGMKGGESACERPRVKRGKTKG